MWDGMLKRKAPVDDGDDLHCGVCSCRNYTVNDGHTIFECGFRLDDDGYRTHLCDRPGKDLAAREDARLRHKELQDAIGTAIKLKSAEDAVKFAESRERGLNDRIAQLERRAELSGKDGELALARAEADLQALRAELSETHADLEETRRLLADAKPKKGSRDRNGGGGGDDDKMQECLKELRKWIKGDIQLGGANFTGGGKVVVLKMIDKALNGGE